MDIQKTMEFILEQQARFSVDIERLSAGLERLSAGMERLSAGLDEMRQEMRDNWAAQARTNMALGTAMLGLTEHIDRVTAAQAATDERLNALIAVVDGIVRREPPK